MKRFQSVVTGISAVALVAAFAAPTFAAKSVIEDEELDEVTAAGQPKIATTSTAVGTATSINFQVNVFAAHIGGQTGLSALTLNNIYGENQIANGVNIQSGEDNSGNQSNVANQSWGSAKAWNSVTVAGAAGGKGKCRAIGVIAKCAAANGAAAAGKIGLLWEFADEIAEAKSTEVGDARAANVVVTIVAGSFDTDAQSNISTLTVNNVFGFNQVANGTNISSGALSGRTDASAGSIGAATTGTATGQANASSQYRGTPRGFTGAHTFF